MSSMPPSMLFGILLTAAAGVLCIPCAVLLVETLASVTSPAPIPAAEGEVPPRIAILVPAHDESLQIGNTVDHLLEQVGARDDLIVIADNCSDDTATLARRAGARVIERTDPTHRGKGFAIAFGMRHLDASPPDVVVLVDADCRIRGRLATLAAHARRTGRPCQAEYLLTAPGQTTPLTAMSGLAILVRNRIRPRGLQRLAGLCQLTGSGMAFPWQVLRDAPETGANLVEDLVMGIEMAIAGRPSLLCAEVEVRSELPGDRAAATSQRRRWEHGQLHTLLVYVPRLLAAGLRRRRPSLVALGLDLAVPPLALLTLLASGVLVVAGVARALALIGWFPFALSGAGLAMLALAILIGWYRFARATIPWRYVFLVPFYVLRKVPLYVSLVLRGKQKTWERTARTKPDSSAPPSK